MSNLFEINDNSLPEDFLKDDTKKSTSYRIEADLLLILKEYG